MWKPIRKIASQIWLAIAGNAAVAGVIAGTDTDYRALGASIGASVLLILTGYLVPSKAEEGTLVDDAPTESTDVQGDLS